MENFLEKEDTFKNEQLEKKQNASDLKRKIKWYDTQRTLIREGMEKHIIAIKQLMEEMYSVDGQRTKLLMELLNSIQQEPFKDVSNESHNIKEYM